MPAASTSKLAFPAAAFLVLVPLAAAAQSGAPVSERAMPDAKSAATGAKSERALPTQTEDAAPVPAAAERAMPSEEK